MREDRHDDLVSTTAIVAGTVAGVAVTVMSLLLAGDESAPPASVTAEPAVIVRVEARLPADGVEQERIGVDAREQSPPEAPPTR